MEILIIWIIITLLTCLLAKSKRRSMIAWGVLSIIIGIFALIILLFMSRGTNGMKKCFSCAEHVESDAKVCKHCGAYV